MSSSLQSITGEISEMTRRITVPGHLGRLVTGNMSYTVMGTSERANRGYALHVSWKLFAGIILVRPVFTWGLGESNQQLSAMSHFQIIGVQGLKIGHSNLLLQSVLYYCVQKPRPLCQVITRKSKNKCLIQTCIFFPGTCTVLALTFEKFITLFSFSVLVDHSDNTQMKTARILVVLIILKMCLHLLRFAQTYRLK